jgi:hypothetical protein
MRFVLASIPLPLLTCARFQDNAHVGSWLPGEEKPILARGAPLEGSIVLCPSSHRFCIDTKYSDPQTCLSPNPHLIKRCYDETCHHSELGRELIEKGMDSSYCKDFKGLAAMVCHHIDTPCTCDESIEQIVYANALVISPGDVVVPEGYAAVSECVYPSKYIRRLPNGEYVDVAPAGEPTAPPVPDDEKLRGDYSWTPPDVATKPPAIRAAADVSTSTTKSIQVSVSTNCLIFAMIALHIVS